MAVNHDLRDAQNVCALTKAGTVLNFFEGDIVVDYPKNISEMSKKRLRGQSKPKVYISRFESLIIAILKESPF